VSVRGPCTRYLPPGTNSTVQERVWNRLQFGVGGLLYALVHVLDPGILDANIVSRGFQSVIAALTLKRPKRPRWAIQICRLSVFSWASSVAWSTSAGISCEVFGLLDLLLAFARAIKQRLKVFKVSNVQE